MTCEPIGSNKFDFKSFTGIFEFAKFYWIISDQTKEKNKTIN